MIRKQREGKSVLITGDVNGIGRAIEERLITEEYHVVTNDLEQLSTEMGRNNYHDEAVFLQVKDKTALGPLGGPEDVVGSVRFFASDAAVFITGQALNVCG